MPLQPGDTAPDFELYDTSKNPVTLKEMLGEKTILAFFPGAFTSTCTKEMCAFRDQLSGLNDLGVKIYGICVDSPAANKAFIEYNKLNFPVLSDFSREVSKKFGGIHEDFWGIKGYSTAKRAVYVLDENGKVTYTWITDNPGVEPDYQKIKSVLGS